MTIGGEGTLNECQTRYTRVENGPTTAGTGKDNRNSGARGMKSTPEICRRRDDHYLTNQYQPQQIPKKPEKVSARSELQKNVCQQMCDTLEKKSLQRVWKLVTS